MSTRFSPGPRVTHLVLVDGLPVDSWVVTGVDAGLDADPDAYGWGRSGSPGHGGDVGPVHDRWDDPDDRRPWSGDDEAWSPTPPRPSQEELRLLDLEELVGGAAALTALDAEPHPAERLDPQSVPLELRHDVVEVVHRCDEVVDRWFDEEARTVLHRLVGVIVADRPTILADPDLARSAASLCWMVGRGNGYVGPVSGSHTVTNKALLAHFRQPPHVVGVFAGRLLPRTPTIDGPDERGSAPWQGRRGSRIRSPSSYLLGRPEWLVARRRLTIIRERDELLRQLADRAAATAAAVDPPPLETVSDPDDGAPEWERSLRLLGGR